MPDMRLTNRQARRFLLYRQGLIGAYRFCGKQGALDYVRQAGCIQFDPVDVCGRNADLVLQSRVRGYRKDMLTALLYRDRALIDCFDKNLAVLPMEDWPCFDRQRRQSRARERSFDRVEAARQSVRDAILARGPVCAGDLDMDERVRWYWSDTRLARAALEHMYFCGELAVHHKKGTIKYYDLAERCIPAPILSAPDPYPDDHLHRKWRVLRRIRSVGLLWNRASDAWLGIDGLTAAERDGIFSELLGEGAVVPVAVEGLKEPLYLAAEGRDALAYIREDPPLRARMAFLAPLDNLLWDRRLVLALFGFDYKWEIYTPAGKRRYGHYTLPILYGCRFVGRLDPVCDRKRRTLAVGHVWYEDGVRPTPAMNSALGRCVDAFTAFQFTGE